MQPFDLHVKEFVDNKGRHERMRTRAQLDAIRASGGMVAAMLKDDVQDTDLKGRKFTVPYAPLFGGPIADNCRHSSKTLGAGFPVRRGRDGRTGGHGQRLERRGRASRSALRQRRLRRMGAPNGLERPAADPREQPAGYPFSVPGFGTLSQQVTGFKTFDYNVDGLAHIGLVPDLVADLSRIGMDAHYVNSLFCSAEAYIRVWERAEALGAGRPAPDAEPPLALHRDRQHAARQQRRADAAHACERLAS